MIVTKHGKKRINKGKFYSAERWKIFKIVHHGFFYIFALDKKIEPRLVTTYKSEGE